MSGKKENVQSSGITRRDFVKGLAFGAASLGIATILPGGIIDRQMTYDEYIEDESIDAIREKLS